MSTEKPITKTEVPKKQKVRSPGYPSIGLKEAVDKVRVIWEHEKRNEVSVDVVAGHWKVAPKSSATLLAISTLKKFGLITDRGEGDRRYVKLTDLAYNILRSEPGTEIWLAHVRKAALSPKIIAELWETEKDNPKSTPNLKKYLEFEKHFNPSSIDNFVQNYKDTISFAKLGIGDKVVTEQSVDGNGRLENDGNGQPSTIKTGAKDSNTQMFSAIKSNELPVPIADGMVARVPYPMSEEDFDLLIGTLQLWKKKLVTKICPPDSTPDKPD